MFQFSKRKTIVVGVLAGAIAVGLIAFAIGPPPDSAPSTDVEVAVGSDAQTIEILDPIHDRPVTMSYWTSTGEDRSHLVVLSHGFAGDRTSHDYLAEELASRGYAVVAPTHPDLAGLESGDGQLDPLVLRPRHLALAIDAAEIESSTPESFDHVTVIGHSLGGYSALGLAGAEPALSGAETHCAANGEDPILCAPQARDRFRALTTSDAGEADERVDRIVLLAPAYAPLFAPEELAALELPVLVLEASDDRQIVGDQIADLVSGLPEGTQTRRVTSGHFDFVRICTAEESSAIPELCATDGIDRQDVHDELIDEISAFVAS